ncbi:Catechol oxidase [Handroanthus impetiginosus]|uniref:Catechol oxidase n=1 Tax=Handroanthus impetiginosus TaxID=429701 RepID=A0A2G9H9F8_9LAMI|nr:Catechol oxidase [Handroanthus impetiginosus]
MKDEMIEKANCIESFMGLPFKKDAKLNPGEGTVERGQHTSVHRWAGGISNPPKHTGEDLGNLYSAGRDPLFFALHANVDRLWTIWRDSRGNKQKDIDDKDYLNAEFLFYDENKQLVRVRVGDCLEQNKMGYRFQTEGVYMPWNRPRISVLKRVEPRQKPMVATTSTAPKVDSVHFPLKLDEVAKFLVQRPKKSRTQEEKEIEEEILEILIEVDTQEFAKFDVFVDDEDENVDKLNRDEYAGTFAQIPQSHGKDPSKVRTSTRLELTRQLENLNVEDDDEILVALVPRAGDVDIAGIKIIYSPS